MSRIFNKILADFYHPQKPDLTQFTSRFSDRINPFFKPFIIKKTKTNVEIVAILAQTQAILVGFFKKLQYFNVNLIKKHR